MTLRVFRVATVVAIWLALGQTGYADQPMGVGWSILKAAPSGFLKPGPQPAGDDQVLVDLFVANKDLSESLLLLVFPGCGEDPRTAGRPVLNLNEILLQGASPRYPTWQDPEPRWRICPQNSAVLLKPGDRPQLMLTVDFLRVVSEGMSPRLGGAVYEVSRADLESIDPLDNPADALARLMSDRQPVSTLILDLYYRLNEKDLSWKSGGYHDVFGAAQPSKRLAGGMTGDYGANAALLPVDLLAFRSSRRLPGSFKDDGGARLKRTLETVYLQRSGQAGDPIRFQEEVKLQTPLVGALSAEDGVTESSFHSHTLSGRFSTKWTSDHTLHPGFGFRVEAWTNETGVWRQLASGWVQANGTWSLAVPLTQGYLGRQLRVLYRSYNGYYAPQNQAGNTYSWVDPDQFNIPASFDAGHRYADTDGGTYNGVGELVDAAMNMWSRLYWDGGINPVPASPLKFYFPNTWENCGGTSPWSCASTAGEIWLIAAHGIQAAVVTHEMGHQLNNKYWNGKRPAGSGGSHTLTGCYPTRLGMALREGFANFIPAWVGYPNRFVADGGFGAGRWALGYDTESRVSPPTCANGWENEVWVARTFWDLHDTRSDGTDVLWFNHLGAVISLFLANGVANDGDALDMRNYEPIYRGAASAGHQGYISDIFDQNRH